MTLPPASIKTFEDFMRVFLTRYAVIKPPKLTNDALIEIKQGQNETLKSFLKRFSDTSNQIDDLNHQIALLAIRNGLQKGGPGSL